VTVRRFAITAITIAASAAGLSSAACGKRGDPLAPLRLVPATMGEFSARRAAQQVELRFTVPTANANGPGPIELDRVEMYAVTVGAGAVPPPNRDLLTKARLVGSIQVKPPPVEGGPQSPPTVPEDRRPGPGDPVTFVEELTDAKLTPIPLVTLPPAKPGETGAAPGAVAAPDAGAPGTVVPGTGAPGAPPPVAAAPGAAAPGAAAPGAAATTPDAAAAPGPVAAPPLPPVTLQRLTRIYVVRGLTRSGRPGPPTTRAMVPLESPVAAPTAVAARMPTEKAVAIDWTPPVAEPGGAPVRFNVYRQQPAGAPLNPSPLTTPAFEIANEEFGKEHCYVVRTIQTTQNVTVESDPSAPACLTPLDTFPPAAPRNLRAVAEEGAVSLVWDPNTEPDLAGYLVLRGDSAGGTLQPITPQPLKDATYRDTTVMPGVRYVYAVVAVDAATPARNSSPPSPQEAVTAR
jgi:hypothetical protein